MSYTTYNPAEAFLGQNPICAETLSLEDVGGLAEHHAGGLAVLGAPASIEGRYVKMHDTWGPGKPDEPGEIVVHEFYLNPAGEEHHSWEIVNEDGIPEQAWDDGSYVWFFDSGRAAYEFFLSRIG